MATISNMFKALFTNMTDEERKTLFLRETININCSKNCHHSHTRESIHSTYLLHNTYINIADISNSVPIQVLQRILTQQGTTFSGGRSSCLQKNGDGSECGGILTYTSSITNQPFIFAIEIDKDEGRSVEPALN